MIPVLPIIATSVIASLHADDAVQRIQAGPLSLQVSVDRTSMNVAQLLTVSLRCETPPGIDVQYPAFESKLGDFSIDSTTDEPDRASAGAEPRTVRTRRIALEPFLPGDYTIPPIEVKWIRATESGIARTEPIRITVSSLLPAAAKNADPKALDPGTIRDEYVPPTPTSHRSIYIIAGVAFGAGAIAALGFRAILRRRKPSDPVDAAIAHLTAMSYEVDAPRVCDAVSIAIRTALADRIDPAARSWQTSETTTKLASANFIGRELAARVTSVLENADNARFAGASMPADQCQAFVREGVEVLRAIREFTPRGGAT